MSHGIDFPLQKSDRGSTWQARQSLWASSELTTKTKLDLRASFILSRLLYAAEKCDKRRLLEMRCYRRRRILKISRRNWVSNIRVRQRLQRHSLVVSIIAKRKLWLFGHICRMDDDRLVKTVMLEMVDWSTTSLTGADVRFLL